MHFTLNSMKEYSENHRFDLSARASNTLNNGFDFDQSIYLTPEKCS